MPSAEYYSRQADLCLRLSLLSGDEEAAKLLILKALEMLAQAAAARSLMRAEPAPEVGELR